MDASYHTSNILPNPEPSLNLLKSESDFPSLEEPSSKRPFPKPLLRPIQHQQPIPLTPLYLVFDTNIWLKGLDFISEICYNENLDQYVIYVPDIVAIELNKSKEKGSSDEVRKLARQAIHFQNRTLRTSQKVRQQRRDEAVVSYKFYHCFNNDDRIIATCLQLRREGKDVSLCTRDKSIRKLHSTLPSNKFRTKKETRCSL